MRQATAFETGYSFATAAFLLAVGWLAWMFDEGWAVVPLCASAPFVLMGLVMGSVYLTERS